MLSIVLGLLLVVAGIIGGLYDKTLRFWVELTPITMLIGSFVLGVLFIIKGTIKITRNNDSSYDE